MERLRQRLEAAEKALVAFEKLATLKNPNDVERDAAIQRFEFTFEASWKAAKQYLYDVEGVVCRFSEERHSQLQGGPLVGG